MDALSRREVLAASSLVLVSDMAMAAKTTPPARLPPALEFAFEARITLSPPIEQGMIDGKRKRFIAITGGSIAGPRLNGMVLPGGGDWQSIHADGLTEVGARYSIKADDGTVIAITNPGVRVASAAIIARLTAGEDVDPALYYFRTTPSFEVQAGRHEWLRRNVFVARGIRRPDHVVLEYFVVG